MKIELLRKEDEEQYEQFLHTHDALLYASLIYRKILEKYLGDESVYLVAKDNGTIVGAMPLFIRMSEKYGNVINSLPFYGSNGGVISDDSEVTKELLRHYIELLQDRKCVAGTVVISPFDKFYDEYQAELSPRFLDKRIGQITFFDGITNDERLDENLMSLFHYKTRNTIRKAVKSEIVVRKDNSDESFQFLFKTHTENMAQIGGIGKEWKFFEVVKNVCSADKDYDIFVAYKDGVKCAALLVLYYGNTVEYFTPVTVAEYRTYQPLSLAIFEAMKVAIKKGYKRWNWGGTWITQNGVYDFKRKWGTKDLMYYYFVSINDDSILKVPPEDILKIYKNYYVFPFGG